MGFVKPTDTVGQPLNVNYAEHNSQYANVFTSQLDAGIMSLMAPVSAPGVAPTVTLSAGSLNGSYQWGTYWITGIPDGTGAFNVTGRTLPSAYSAAQPLTNQQGTVSISGETIPTGVIGWGVVRNKAGGGTWYIVPNSEQFLNLSGAMPTTFADNVADTSLVTAAPSANTTGTNLQFLDFLSQYASNVGNNQIYTTVQFKRRDGTLYMESDLSNPDANGNYQTDTLKFYDTNGTTLLSTHVWALTYDTNSKLTSKVMTS